MRPLILFVYFVNFVVKFLLDFLMVWGDGTRTLVSATRRGRRQMPGSRAGWLRAQRAFVTTRSGWLAICAMPISASPVPGNINPGLVPCMLKWHKMVAKSSHFVPLFGTYGERLTQPQISVHPGLASANGAFGAPWHRN